MTRNRYHLTDHALLDSIPLRLGLVLGERKIYLESMEIDELGTRDQRQSEQTRGNYHVLADCFLGDGTELGRWRLVLGKPYQERHDPPVITVLGVDRGEMRSEGSVTEILKRERESRMHDWLTPEYVADVLYKLYRDGKLSRVEQINEHIRERDRAPLIRERDSALREAERVRTVALEAIDAMEDSARKVSELEVQNRELEAQNREWEKKETLRQKREAAEARAQNHVVSLSQADTLVDVREGCLHRGSSCTVLVMGDGTQRYMKTDTFDRDGMVTAKAKGLIGRRIRISCWDPVNEPGKWTRQGYFRNVYGVDLPELSEAVGTAG